MRAANPEMGSLMDFENWLAPLVETYKAQVSSGKIEAVQTIPVVFHVIHGGENVGSGANLSASVINAQLNQLNADYAGQGSGQATNTEIQFCMATITPDGCDMPEPGIDRIDGGAAGFGNPPYGRCRGFNINLNDIEGGIKPATSWDPDRYCNIWVMPLNCGLLGYAQFPDNSGLPGLNTSGGAANTDGVVVDHRTVGSLSQPSPVASSTAYDNGRTLSHEIGHWLGLRHIWGDGGCTVDDFCGDTPASDSPNYGCPNVVKCGSTDQVENFMDYTDDACMELFTDDQKARMKAVMANSPRRVLLASSTACTDQGITCNDGGGGSGGGGGGGGNGNGNGNGNGGGKPRRVVANSPIADLIVFPNPTQNLLNIQFNSMNESTAQVVLVDLMGRVVFQQNINVVRGGNSIALDLNALAQGSYMLRLVNGETMLARRITKNN